MKKQATGIGFIAIILWSSLALFTSQVGSVPPMLTLAITLGMSSILLLIVYFVRGELSLSWKNTPCKVMLFGGLSYFSYTFLFFYAVQHSTDLLVGLLAYLWPLLIVISLSFGRKNLPNWPHIIGGLLALGGTVLMFLPSTQMSTVLDITLSSADDQTAQLSYLAAISASLVWGGYTLINRRFSAVPSSSVLWNCIIASILAICSHLLFEPVIWHFSQNTWIAMVGLGFGPIGIAFLCWDIGMKRGNLSLLGVLSFTAPALSLLWTIIFGTQTFGEVQIIAAICVIVGIVIAIYKTNKSNIQSTVEYHSEQQDNTEKQDNERPLRAEDE